jgi:hypothetical protein
VFKDSVTPGGFEWRIPVRFCRAFYTTSRNSTTIHCWGIFSFSRWNGGGCTGQCMTRRILFHGIWAVECEMHGKVRGMSRCAIFLRSHMNLSHFFPLSCVHKLTAHISHKHICTSKKGDYGVTRNSRACLIMALLCPLLIARQYQEHASFLAPQRNDQFRHFTLVSTAFLFP